MSSRWHSARTVAGWPRPAADRTIKLWDARTGEDVFTLRGHTSGVVAVAFSPDGNLIVSGGVDNTARVWNAIPLPANRIAEHDSRYRDKIMVLEQLNATTDDSQRAQIMASNGQWGIAAAAFGSAVEHEPDNVSFRYHHMLCLLENGDLPAYRQAAKNLLTKFGKATDPNKANNAAWYCVLGADALPDLNAPVRMAEAALAAFGPEDKRVALNTLGAVLYRAGRLDEAIQRLEESVRTNGGVGVPQDWAFLVMAYWKKENGEAARRWLDKLRSHNPGAPAGFSPEAVEIGILRREAEAIVHDSPPTRP